MCTVDDDNATELDWLGIDIDDIVEMLSVAFIILHKGLCVILKLASLLFVLNCCDVTWVVWKKLYKKV